MISVLLESAIILYGFLQVLVAFIAVILAVKWEKYEFLAGLFLLLLYSIVEIIDMFIFTILNNVFFDIAQFGFILLAIIFFIIGMHPSWSPKLVSGLKKRKPEHNPSRTESVISILRKS
jgi:ABC-type polysaccharide/polyol phosphate export permease